MPARDLSNIDRETALHWAERYWKLIRREDARAERLFEREFPAARRRGFLTKSLFVRVGAWKSPRPRFRLEQNSPREIKRQTRLAFRAHDRADAIRALCRLSGVATRMAVAMLHWMRPNQFPMLDVRVVRSLGWEDPPSSENLDFYERFAEHVQAHARRLSIELRALDRALWAMDKENQERAE